MRHYTYLRLLLAGFLLYFAWPYIPEATSTMEKLFWGVWLGFLWIVVGGNLATLLQLSKAPLLEQKQVKQKRDVAR